MDFQDCHIEAADKAADRLSFPLADGVEVVIPLLLLSAIDEMHSQGPAQLFKGVNRSRFQTRVPLLCCPFEGCGECPIEDGIRCFLEEQCYLEGLHMIDGVSNPIVSSELG